MKEFYTKPELEIVRFMSSDIVTESGGTGMVDGEGGEEGD